MLLQNLVAYQREIYLALADQIKLLAAGGGWLAFLAFLPLGVLFGVAHALTPGHSKALLATYLVGSDASMMRGLRTAFTLSLTHISMAVLIAVLALPLVSVALGSVGRAPLLEQLSRGLVGIIGLWMLWRAIRGAHDQAREGEAVGIMAGLIPCPLTLFVMNFAMARGVPIAGLLFAVTMLIGVLAVLAAVALLTTFFRTRLDRLLQTRQATLGRLSRALEGTTGIILFALAVLQILR